MPKLLDYFKEKEISHEDAIAFFEKNYKPEAEEEEEEEEQKEEEENDKPDKEEGKPNDKKSLDIDIGKLASDITKNVSQTVSKTISGEIKKQIKKLRGKPPEGVNSEDAIGNNPYVKKNLFERRV